MKRLILALFALVCTAAHAQFTTGQVLTAAQLNSQFALYVPIAGGTLTGPLTAPTLNISNSSLGATGTLGYDTTTWSPYELEMSINAGGNNVLHLTNTNNGGFSAIAFRGTDINNPSSTQVNEHMALGWSNSASGSLDAFEFSNFNNTNPLGYPPAHFVMMQSGAVDPTGGVIIQCNMTAGSAQLTGCAGVVPAAASTLYVEGYGILDNTQIASGGGTTSPVLTQAVTATYTPGNVRFWTPTSAQRQFFSAERDNQAYFNNFDGSQAIVINRASSQDQVGIYGGQLASTRQILGSTTSDTATTKDRFILWNASATSAKSETILGCTTPALVASGTVSTAGQILTVADEAGTAATYPITVTPSTGQINFGSSATISQNYGAMHLVCDGQGNWLMHTPWTLSANPAVSGGFTAASLAAASVAPVNALNDTGGSTGATLRWELAGSNRWEWKNYGSDGSMNLGRFVSGTYTDNPISVSNSTGVVSIPDGLTLKGATVLPNLSGTTSSIGGSALAAGACSSGTVAVTNSTTSMAVVATPATYPGDGIFWHGYVSAAGTVTVKVCASVAATPTASAYNVRVLQ